MRHARPALAPVFRTDAQGKILASVLPALEPLTITEVATEAGIPFSTAHREVAVLEQADVITSRKIGQIRLLSPNREHPLYGPLSAIAVATYGPPTIVREAFDELDGVEELFIYGSWAARLAGEPGAFPADIDVAVVGDGVSVLGATMSAAAAEARVGRPVNVTVIDRSRWEAGTDGFVAELKARPRFVLKGANDVKGRRT